MDPNWVAIGISGAGIVFTGITAYQAARRGTEVAIARQDEKHASLKEQVIYLTEAKDELVERVGNHDLRLGLIEGRQPVDYSR